MRGNGCLLLTGYYWSFSVCCQSQNCQIAGLVLACCPSIQELRGRSPADQSNSCLKRHFSSDSDSIRGEQPGSEPNKSVCQDCNKSVESCLPLIAPSTTQKCYAGKERKKKKSSFCEIDWLHLLVSVVTVNVSPASETLDRSLVGVVYKQRHFSIFDNMLNIPLLVIILKE